MTDAGDEKRFRDYLEAFGPVDDDRRRELLLRSVSDDVEFTNPGASGKGVEDLIRHVADFQRKMPGAHFAMEAFHEHHDELLAVWSMHAADGTRKATGYNFVQLGHDRRFRYMAGFF